MVMKSKLSSSQTLSIAAPASYWYLQNFPIERISRVIDYIVYMTYDLHGQWDYGNVNAFDSCSSGKCIRSHGEFDDRLLTTARALIVPSQPDRDTQHSSDQYVPKNHS